MTEFKKFPKIARYCREVIVSEKIDGTNASIYIGNDGEFLTGSRNRWIVPSDDNYGFSAWAHEHKEELLQLGAGLHYGEWWGKGIQRKYGMDEKRFSLFNAVRWCKEGEEPQLIPKQDPRIVKYQEVLPGCCDLVPVLWRGSFEDLDAKEIMKSLKGFGSQAAPGYFNPEGIVIFHTAGSTAFKMTFESDTKGKGRAGEMR